MNPIDPIVGLCAEVLLASQLIPNGVVREQIIQHESLLEVQKALLCVLNPVTDPVTLRECQRRLMHQRDLHHDWARFRKCQQKNPRKRRPQPQREASQAKMR